MEKEYPLALPSGSVLAGKYIVDRVLGQGGFGITYKATDYDSGRSVAIKEYFPDCLATRMGTTVTHHGGEYAVNYTYGMDCFLEEAKTLASFSGIQGIVSIYCYFEENSTAYYVMDYLEGQSFSEYLSQKGGKLSYEETEKIMLPVMEALSKVHEKGVVHRDVAPDNIYILKDGTVKLLDFGAARQSLGDKSKSLDVVLKHGFAPKEQYSRRGRQGPFTDVYSTAACFYTALTGHRPMDSIDRLENDELLPPSKEGAVISPEKENVLMMALAVQAANRFQKMSAFIHALRGMVKLQQQPNPMATVAVFGNQLVAPGQNIPVQNIPTQNSPMQSTFMQQAPLQNAPAQNVPLGTAASGKMPLRQPSMNAQALKPYDPNYQKPVAAWKPSPAGNMTPPSVEDLQENYNRWKLELLQLNEEKRDMEDILLSYEEGLADCSAGEFSRKRKLTAQVKKIKEQIQSKQQQIDRKANMIQQIRNNISQLQHTQSGMARSEGQQVPKKTESQLKEEMQFNQLKMELLQLNEEKRDLEAVLLSCEAGVSDCSSRELSRRSKLTSKIEQTKELIRLKQQQIEQKTNMLQQIRKNLG